MGAALQLTGKRFGKVVVIEKTKRRTRLGLCIWKCQCDCGKIAFIHGSALKVGNTRSCGCLSGKKANGQHGNYKHGMCPDDHPTREYVSWLAMKQRCYYKGNRAYHQYGGRGIKVCEEWRVSFAAFFKSMGPKPTPKHTLDRIDVNGDYEPGNCRWATRTQQALNRRPRRRPQKK